MEALYPILPHQGDLMELIVHGHPQQGRRRCSCGASSVHRITFMGLISTSSTPPIIQEKHPTTSSNGNALSVCFSARACEH